MADLDQKKMLLTLIALMKITDSYSTLEDTGIYWSREYSDQIEGGFRVCDFALVKYHQSIEPIDIKH